MSERPDDFVETDPTFGAEIPVTMTEPSGKARELVDALHFAGYECGKTDLGQHGKCECNQKKAALLTYIADLERRAHPEGEVRGALEEAVRAFLTDVRDRYDLGPREPFDCEYMNMMDSALHRLLQEGGG